MLNSWSGKAAHTGSRKRLYILRTIWWMPYQCFELQFSLIPHFWDVTYDWWLFRRGNMNAGWPYFTKLIPDYNELSMRFFCSCVGVLKDFQNNTVFWFQPNQVWSEYVSSYSDFQLPFVENSWCEVGLHKWNGTGAGGWLSAQNSQSLVKHPGPKYIPRKLP